MDCPSPERRPLTALGIGKASSIPPFLDILKKRDSFVGTFSLVEVKRTCCPSGVHPVTRSGPGCQVSRFGSPPSTGMTYTSVFPSYWAVNAIHFPSGEKWGRFSAPSLLVNLMASPPFLPTLQRSLAWTKTI